MLQQNTNIPLKIIPRPIRTIINVVIWQDFKNHISQGNFWLQSYQNFS